MRENLTRGLCVPQREETYACSSLGFRNQNKCVTTNCKKGGLALWQN
jgi:hypothetical protein